MIHVLHCKSCNESLIPLGQASCHITFSVSKHCDHCHESKQRKYDLYFCSAKCFVKWYDENKDLMLRNVARFEKNESFPFGYTEPDENNVIRSYLIEEKSEYSDEPLPASEPA